jgi:abortive infection bacteriophage resistance protein
MTQPFRKPPKTWAEQATLLQSRGMVIDPSDSAEDQLKHLNYYRLAAYWLPFEADHATHTFKPGTKFSEVLNLYTFDRLLRLLVLDAIERIEVSVRAVWAYYMAHLHGTHAHLDSTLAKKNVFWLKDKASLEKEVFRSDETFITHMRQTYSESLPPVWASCEVMSLGLLSRWYENLGPMKTRSAIAGIYGLNESTLASWLRHLTVVRNTCAHHSRLWNRDFSVTPAMPGNKPSGLSAQWAANSRKIYNSILIILHFLDQIATSHTWRNELKALIATHDPNLKAMGFRADWQNLNIWK